MDVSGFNNQILTNSPDMQLHTEGLYCDTYLVRMYGKLHFAKKLKMPYATMPMYRAAFAKEFETGYRLEHPALPQYFSLDDKGDEPFIIEEYIEGNTLTAFVNDNPNYFKTRKHADTFIDELLSVIGYLHQHDIIYLDLKPDNIIVSSIGHQLRLVDLGGCWTCCFDNTTARTPSFAAPEQLKDGYQASTCTDIFLIGRTLQYINVPHIYNKVVKQCLQEKPTDRYSSVEELLAAVWQTRRRGTIRILSWTLPLATIIISLLLLIPMQEKGSSATQKSTPVEHPTLHEASPKPHAIPQQPPMSQSKTAEESTQTKEKAETVENVTPTPSVKVADNSNASTKGTMIADLHRAMDKAFDRHLAPLNKYASFDAITWSEHWLPYTDEVERVVKDIHGKYPSIPLSEIKEQSERYMSQTVSPMFAKLRNE